MTKCGRYGVSSFDYSPATIRESVKRSLQRLKTDYLDTVYLHDVEFVCTAVSPRETGNHASALRDEPKAYGLAEGDEARVRGEGDQKILDAYHELQELQREGLVRKIGITGRTSLNQLIEELASSYNTPFPGYPLPTLLRLAILILHTPPYKPLDVLLSYSHLCLQNATYLDFIPHFYKRAQVGQLVAASPLSMGLLKSDPPPWHPAPPDLRMAVVSASKIGDMDLPNLATGYSLRHTISAERPLPLVVGFSTPREVHECIKVWREVQTEGPASDRKEIEELARNIFRDAGYLDWSWASP
jgi:D-arabinose 1-dehydrogenase